MEYYLIALIFAVILGITGALIKTSGTRKKVLWIGGIIGVVGIIGIFAFPTAFITYNAGTGLSFFAVTGGTGSGEIDLGNTGTVIDVTGCSTTDSQTITLSATDKYTSVATGGSHRYKINGAPALTVSDAGTFTAYVGNNIEVLWMNASLTSYFSNPESFKVTCNGPRTFYTTLANNGTLTSSLKDNLGIAMTGGVNQTLGAGDVKDVQITLSGQYQKEFPNGFVGVIDYNKTTIDDVILNKDGINFASAIVPQTYSITYSSESNTKAYEIPAVLSNADLVFKVTLDADDTINPTVSGSDVILTLFPKNYFINEKNGGSFDGPSAQDENNAVTRTGSIAITINID